MLIYFETLDNTFCFYIGCSDWHHEVFYCQQKDASVVPWDSLYPDDQIFLQDRYADAGGSLYQWPLLVQEERNAVMGYYTQG